MADAVGMPKYTPGPWITNRTHDASMGRSVGTARGSICLLVTDGAYTASEQTSNARLIAAAPELLGALHEINRIMRECRLHPDDLNLIACLRGTANKAIAKAEGRG